MPETSFNFTNHFAGLGEHFYTRVIPRGFANPHLVSSNAAAAKLLDIDPRQLREPWFLQWCSGNLALQDSDPLAMVYAGHQFGDYVPQLGDGRGLLLGNIASSTGNWDLHLKGAGQTPYSRFGDGRAVLRSTIREYLCSEAMAGLGIPTTRALAIAGSDETVLREAAETGAMLIRVARTHVRFGSFEFFHHSRLVEQVQQLADYAIAHLFTELAPGDYAAMFRRIVHGTATLVARWQAAGFAHGVMNTDNMSILGETLDYGPYGFMEAYNPGFICNHSDYTGRYAFNRQPAVALWNCNALANALTTLIDIPELEKILYEFEPLFRATFYRLMGQKLGIAELTEEQRPLVDRLLKLLAENRVDYAIFFRRLCYFPAELATETTRQPPEGRKPLRDMFPDREAFDHWAAQYQQSLKGAATEWRDQQAMMLTTNPKYILRNYLAETAIRKAENERDYSEVDNLLTVLSNPCEEHPGFEHYAATPPDWARDLSVSCSS